MVDTVSLNRSVRCRVVGLDNEEQEMIERSKRAYPSGDAQKLEELVNRAKNALARAKQMGEPKLQLQQYAARVERLTLMLEDAKRNQNELV